MVKEELIKIRPSFLFYQHVLSLRGRVNVLVTAPRQNDLLNEA